MLTIFARECYLITLTFSFRKSELFIILYLFITDPLKQVQWSPSRYAKFSTEVTGNVTSKIIRLRLVCLYSV